MNRHLRALLRFWWVPVIGLGIAAIAGVSVVDQIKLKVPPKLTPRTKPTYTASTQLLVTSADQPILRTSVKTITAQPPTTNIYRYRDSSGHLHTVTTPVQQPPQVRTGAPDLKPLVTAANLFPNYITSDAVTNLRIKKFGNIPGTVTAQAVGSVKTPGKFKTSPLPAVEISATSPTAKDAISLAQGTAQAFGDYLAFLQAHAQPPIPRTQRILLQQLQIPSTATESSSSSKSLAAVVFLAVLAAFCVLALLLDRAFPKRRPASSDDVQDRDGKLSEDEHEQDAPVLGSERPTFAFATRAREASGEDITTA